MREQKAARKHLAAGSAMTEHKWQHRTRGGKLAFVYADNVEDNRTDFTPRTIHGAVEMKEHFMPFAWTSNGRAFDGGIHPMDLVSMDDVLELGGDVA